MMPLTKVYRNYLNKINYAYYLLFYYTNLGGGGGGKALTMTMTPWNLPHGQWSKKLTMTMTPSILPMVNGQNQPILTI